MSDREITRLVTVFVAVIRMQVDGNKVHRGGNLARVKFFNKLVPGNIQTVQIQPQHIQMPGVFNLGTSRWYLEMFGGGKGRIISPCNLRAPGPESGELRQLVQSDGRLQICHVVLETWTRH